MEADCRVLWEVLRWPSLQPRCYGNGLTRKLYFDLGPKLNYIGTEMAQTPYQEASPMTTRVGELEVSYGARGGTTYRIELWHDGLKKHRVVKGSDFEIVQRKAGLQVDDWEEKWRQAQDRETERRSKEGNKKLAADHSTEAQRELDRLSSVLGHTLKVNDAIDWEQLKDKSKFPEPKPSKSKTPPISEPRLKPTEPSSDGADYQPRFGLLDKLLTSRQPRIIADCQARFEEDHERWKQEVEVIEAENNAAKKKHKAHIRKLEEMHRVAVQQWEEQRSAFVDEQSRKNEVVGNQRAAYMAGSAEAITEYCDLVLSASDYPDYFPQE